VKTVASFDIKYHQFLDENGQLTADKVTALAHDMEQLTELYRLMTLTRVFDTKAIALQRHARRAPDGSGG